MAVVVIGECGLKNVESFGLTTCSSVALMGHMYYQLVLLGDI
jgi:hypothetical protein